MNIQGMTGYDLISQMAFYGFVLVCGVLFMNFVLALIKSSNESKKTTEEERTLNTIKIIKEIASVSHANPERIQSYPYDPEVKQIGSGSVEAELVDEVEEDTPKKKRRSEIVSE